MFFDIQFVLFYRLVAQPKFGVVRGNRAFLESTRKIVNGCGEICNFSTSRLENRESLLLEIYASLMRSIMYFAEKNVGSAYKGRGIHFLGVSTIRLFLIIQLIFFLRTAMRTIHVPHVEGSSRLI